MKNRAGERKKKRRGKKKADQRGIFLARINSECKSDEKSRGFYADFGPS